MRWRLPAFLVLVVLAAPTPGQEAKKDDSTFKQYLGIYTKNTPQQIVLKGVKLKQLGDRSFLVGTPVVVEDDATRLTARTGVVWWVGLSEVTEFYEFDDVRGYRYDGKPAR
jgi:hypothetical protein